MTAPARAVRMADCTGLWRRTLLVDTDGSTDTTSDVRWLQGLSAFVDLRLPAGSAAPDGFAGRLSQYRVSVDAGPLTRGTTPLAEPGVVFHWDRFVGLQPPGPHPDAGRMHWAGDELVEVGLYADYVEHWSLEPVPAQSCWALTLRDHDGRPALLLRVGRHTGWAYDAATGPEIVLDTDDWPLQLDDGQLLVGDANPSNPPRRFGVISSEGTVRL